MSIWTEPSPSDFERWEELVMVDGLTPRDAALQLEFRGSSTFKRADRARHARLLEWWREHQHEEIRDYVGDRLRANVERAMEAEPVYDREGNETGAYTYQGNVANRALELLGKTAGMFRDQVELTGADGGPVRTEGAIVSATGLADVIELARTLGVPLPGGPAADSVSGAAVRAEGGAGDAVAAAGAVADPRPA